MVPTRRFAVSLAACLVLTLTNLPADATEIPLRRLQGDLLTARVVVEGRQLWMLVDIGSTRSIVWSKVAEELDLTPRARFALATANGSVSGLCAGPIQARLSAALGDADEDGVGVEIDCLGWSPELPATGLEAHFDGILGIDALREQPFRLDPGRARLWLGPDALRASGTVVPLAPAEGRPMVTLARRAPSHGGPLRLVLDSGAEEIVLFGEAAASLESRDRVGLVTLARERAVASGRAPKLVGLRRKPRRVLLLPDVRDRVEDGLLPLSLVGAVAIDWRQGVAILGAEAAERLAES